MQAKNSPKGAPKMMESLKSLDENLSDLELKFNLVCKVLAAKTQNESVAMFHETLNGEYMKFANADDSLANEAEVFLQLQNIEKELAIIAACPELYRKNIVAVGGGFSAGKSQFISSFMSSGMKLPISIEPTTAIPAYVMNASKDYLVGYSKNGGAVDLRKIDKNFHAKLNHDFMQGFKFNLKDILPFIVLGTKLKFKNICFIDTPGYNPSGGIANYDADMDTAREFLEEAGAFLWLVGLDSTGTMPSGDLEFLSSLDLESKRLYVVINKADLRAPSDLKAITDTVKQSLDNYGISYEGIQTFSSIGALENPCIVDKSLDEFLSECDKPSKKHIEILNKLKNIYQAYKSAIDSKIKEKKSIQKTLQSISIDILEDGLDDMSSRAHARLGELKSAFSTKKEEENLKLLKAAMDKFKEAVKTVFGLESSSVNFDWIDDEIKNTQKNEILALPKGIDKKKEKDEYARLVRGLKEIIEETEEEEIMDSADNIIYINKRYGKAVLNMFYEMAKNSNIHKSQYERFVNDFMKASDQEHLGVYLFVRDNLSKSFDGFEKNANEFADSIIGEFSEKTCNKFRKNVLQNLSKFEAYLNENYQSKGLIGSIIDGILGSMLK